MTDLAAAAAIPSQGDLRENHDRESEGADLALCQMLHSYAGWGVVANEPRAGTADVGNWIASAELIRQVPWTGEDFLADGRYVESLAAKAKRIAKVDRPLFVKN